MRAVIFDLGLSRFNPTEPVAPDDNSSADITATASRVAIGTPAYMAPEQILDARRSTEASDIYGVGVVLYLAVSGRHPFVGDERAIANALAVAAQDVRMQLNDRIVEELAKLPADERRGWAAFWSDVELMHKQATSDR